MAPQSASVGCGFGPITGGKSRSARRSFESTKNSRSPVSLHGPVAFSPDGNYIYYREALNGIASDFNVYRTPVLGGTPKAVVLDVDTVLLSPPDLGSLKPDYQWASRETGHKAPLRGASIAAAHWASRGLAACHHFSPSFCNICVDRQHSVLEPQRQFAPQPFLASTPTRSDRQVLRHSGALRA